MSKAFQVAQLIQMRYLVQEVIDKGKVIVLDINKEIDKYLDEIVVDQNSADNDGDNDV